MIEQVVEPLNQTQVPDKKTQNCTRPKDHIPTKEELKGITKVVIEEGCYRCGNTVFNDDRVVVYCPICGLVRGHENMVTEEEKESWRVKRNAR